MPTKARFGRLPRSAPSLTSTIVALAQQYQGQRDRNIETAWKEGGLFEGKKVTDSAFMNHWQARMKDVSPDDPMHDYYNNLIYSYNFEIAESKMGLKYADEQVSDGEMASFYREWAAKLPKDSEGYRSLMTQAAKFKHASAARGNGGRAQATENAYGRSQQSTYDHEEQPFNVARSLITNYALTQGFLDRKDIYDEKGQPKGDFGWSKLINAEGEDDPELFSALLNNLSNDPATSKYITDAIKQYDPNFSGTFNLSTLTTLANNARNGATAFGNRAARTGHKDDVNASKKRMDGYSLDSTLISVSLGRRPGDSFVEQNAHYRSIMDSTLNNSSSSPLEKSEAMAQYKNWLTGQGTTTLIRSLPPGSLDETSPNFNPVAGGIMGRINGTVDALNGKASSHTLLDDLFGNSTEKVGATSDAVKLAGIAADNMFAMDNIAAGTAIVVRTDGKGKPDPNGTGWEVFDRSAPEVAGNERLIPYTVPSTGSYTSPEGGAVGGTAGETRYLVATPMKVRMHQYQDPATGAYTGEVKPFPGMDDTVGMQVDMPGPGGLTTMYGTFVNGRLKWSITNPMAENPTRRETTDPDGTKVYNYSGADVPVAGYPTGTQPKVGFQPQQFVNSGLLMDPSTKPGWDPATDKQTAFDSPWEGFAGASSHHMEYVVTQIGADGIRSGEQEWYRDASHWTPDMETKFNASVQAGVDPQSAFSSTVYGKSGELVSKVNYARQFGYTPEQQDNTMAGLRMQAEQMAAARGGQTLGEYRRTQTAARDEDERTSLMANLSKWDIDTQRANMQTIVTPGGTVRSGTGQEAVDPKRGTRQVLGPSGLPKGWTVGDLLSQPGLDLTAANDLVAQITGGKYGKRFGYAPVPGEKGTGLNLYPPSAPAGASAGQNPFMPKPGSVGPSMRGPAAGPNAGYTPAMAPLKPAATLGPSSVSNVSPHDLARLQPKQTSPHDLARGATTVTPYAPVKPPAVKGFDVVQVQGGEYGYKPVKGGKVIY